MDPLSITASVIGITATCVTTAKSLHDLRSKYKDAPMTVLSICSETTLISASLSQVQNLILRKEDLTSLLQARSDLAAALDTALIGCAVLFSCLDDEVQRINETAISPGQFSWKGKVRVLWNNDRLKELLDALRGQLAAINAVVNLLSLDTLADIKHMLQGYTTVFTDSVQRAKSFRQTAAASHKVPGSIYGDAGNRDSTYDVDAFSIAASEREFDFDDLVVNSKIYRRVLAQAKHRAHETGQPVIETDLGDLIDLTDAETVKNADNQNDLEGAVRLLDGIIIADGFNLSFDASDSNSIQDEEGYTATPLVKSVKRSGTGLTEDPNLTPSDNQDPSTNDSTSNSDEAPPRPVSVQPPIAEPSTPKTPATRPTSNTVASPTRICTKCDESITGQFCRALGGMFHVNCLTCMDCGATVASKFFPLDDGKQDHNAILCERDFFRRLDLLCFSCGRALRGSYITACERKYHLEHFCCEVCGIVFGADDSYYEHGQSVYCHFDYSLSFAQKCHGCTNPIMKQFVEIVINGKNTHWHPECYMIHKYWNANLKSDRVIREVSRFFITAEQGPKDRSGLHALMDASEVVIAEVWRVMSTFEEATATNISDMLLYCSNADYLSALQTAATFICRINALLKSLDTVVAAVATVERSISSAREVKLLCKKIVQYFSLIATANDGVRRLGVTQELLSLVTGMAHYVKLTMRIGLTTALHSAKGSKLFTDAMTNLTSAQALQEARISQRELTEMVSPQADQCEVCDKPVEAECFETNGRLTHIECATCRRCNRRGKFAAASLRKAQINQDFSVCKNCSAKIPNAWRQIKLHEQYVTLLWIALARLTAVLQLPYAEVLEGPLSSEDSPGKRRGIEELIDESDIQSVRTLEGIAREVAKTSVHSL